MRKIKLKVKDFLKCKYCGNRVPDCDSYCEDGTIWEKIIGDDE